MITKNALLVAKNSRLRMHLSLMPVQYRDFAAHHQQTNSSLYQDQRREPKVIIPSGAHLKGGEIRCTPAPMSHLSVQECMRDAVYSTMDQSRATYDQALKLKRRLTEDSVTKRIPLKSTAITKYDTISSTRPTEWTRTTDGRLFDCGTSEPLSSQSNRDWDKGPRDRSPPRGNKGSRDRSPPRGNKGSRDRSPLQGNKGSRKRSPSWGKGKRYNEGSRNAQTEQVPKE
jgi:hypothetical protein